MAEEPNERGLHLSPEHDAMARVHKASAYYGINLRRDGAHRWIGTCPELPGVFGDGEYLREALDSLTEAVYAAVAAMIEAGQEPPEPMQ